MQASIHCTILSCLLLLMGCSQGDPSKSEAGSATGSTTTGSSTETVSADQSAPSPVNVEQTMAQIRAFYDAGNYRAAFPLLDQLHAAKACPAEGYAIRATILDHSGLVSQAIASLTLALTQQPKNAEWHNMLGLLFVKGQNFPMAYQAFTKAIELQPEFSKAYNNRGLMYIAQKEFGQAINDFNLAIQYDPKYIDAHNNRGYAYLEQGNYAKAVENFSEAVKHDPNYVKGYNNRGFALMKIGDAEQSLADFTKAIELAPQVAKHYLHRRDAWLALGNQAEADKDQAQARWVQELALINQKLLRDSKNPAILVERAEHYASMEKFDEAFTDLSRAEQLDASLSRLYRVRANIYHAQKNYQAVIESCTKAIEFNQEFESLSLRGDAYLAMGKLDQAIEDYTTAQRFDGAVAMAYWQRAESRKEQGDQAGAEQDRQTALKLDPQIESTLKK